MSHQPTVTEIRLHNTIACLTPAIALLNELSDNFGTAFVPVISTTTLSLMSAVQNVKKNKEECVQLMENVYQLLCAIVNLYIKEIHEYDFPFVTLHKIHAFVEAQQVGSRLKHFFRQTRTKTLLMNAVEVFKIETGVTALGNITQMQHETQRMHQEVLESSRSNSISMLPAKPKIFYGRQSELMDVVDKLSLESPRIAILGAGGMGKTSLAKAALHHPDIATKYQKYFFVVADAVSTSVELEVLIGEHIGLQAPNDITKQVMHYFATTGPSLLILDNLETVWEPMESRREVEEFLSKLSDIPHLALMPLSDVAAHEIFFAIADDIHDRRDVYQVLSVTDNMPLAVDLIAHAVDYEGSCRRTSLLSAGHDRRSNLDISITSSLSSPRMTTGAKDLLSLLSILPDGLSDVELVQSKLTINDLMTCKAALLATSMHTMDSRNRVKSLVPVREHMQSFYPPSPHLIHQLREHFHRLLDLYSATQQRGGKFNQLTSNVGNTYQTIERTLSLNPFTRQTEHEYYHLNRMLMGRVAAVRPQNCDERYMAQLITGLFESGSPLLSDAGILGVQAISHHPTPVRECKFTTYRIFLWVGHSSLAARTISGARQYPYNALDLSKSHTDSRGRTDTLGYLGSLLAPMHTRASCRSSEASGDLFFQDTFLELLASCGGALSNRQKGRFLCQMAHKLLTLSGTKELETRAALQQALRFLGDVVQAEGGAGTSGALLAIAFAGFIGIMIDIHRNNAECMLKFGGSASAQEHISKAVELWKSATTSFERSSQAKKVTYIDGRITPIPPLADMRKKHTENLTRLVQFETTDASVE
ncbi:hypothetical protein FB451DRAFT_1288975 [Mycena latifolia]|nr:hypothetical protein FB451DRAFT_1288975 [Mycena latifolia]